MSSYIAPLLHVISTLFEPLINFAVSDTYIGGLVIFSIVLTLVGSFLHFMLART